MDVIDFSVSTDTRNSYLLFQETKGEASSTLPLRLFRTNDFVQSLRVKKERGKTAKTAVCSGFFTFDENPYVDLLNAIHF